MGLLSELQSILATASSDFLISRSAILTAVMERLSEATPSDNYACLLDACIEAQEIRP
jgi:hypothetical protein